MDNFRRFSFENKTIHLIVLNCSMQIISIDYQKALLGKNFLYQIIFLFYHYQLLFIFDEPTTGLHFHDVKKLIDSFQALLNNGHSIIAIEHNLDVLKCADWLIDMGPEGGLKGGTVVYQGVPSGIPATTHTGRFLHAASN